VLIDASLAVRRREMVLHGGRSVPVARGHAVVCFGHGPPLRDPAAFARAVRRLGT
jgi:hypothetical protein